MYTNAHSIVNKIDELKSFVQTTLPDVCITEAWTNPNISNHYLNIPGFQIVAPNDQNDSRNGRGGIIIYLKDSLKANVAFKMLKGITGVDPSTWFTKISRANGAQMHLSSDPLALESRKSRLDLRTKLNHICLPDNGLLVICHYQEL